jgi:hypothetical protein
MSDFNPTDPQAGFAETTITWGGAVRNAADALRDARDHSTEPDLVQSLLSIADGWTRLAEELRPMM